MHLSLIYNHKKQIFGGCMEDYSNKKVKDQIYESHMMTLDRNNFKSQFWFIYEKEPTDEQLDMFIAFMLGKETDIEKVRRICDAEPENFEKVN